MLSVSATPQNVTFHRLQNACPPLNIKATVVPCPDIGAVFIYGGFDENDVLDSKVYLLDLALHQWETDEAHAGLYREGHLAIYIGEGDVLVFGGIPSDEDDLVAAEAPMMVYSVTKKNWQQAPAMFLENAPSARSRHACCLSEDGKSIFISGGLVNSSPLSDLYCYSLESGSWSGPMDFVARFDHLIAVRDDKIYSFGGLDAEMNHVNDKITVMDLGDCALADVTIGERKGRGASHDDALQHPRHSGAEESGRNLEHFWLDLGRPDVKLEVVLPLLWCANETRARICVSLVNIGAFKKQLFINNSRVLELMHESDRSAFSSHIWRVPFFVNKRLFLLGENDTSFEGEHPVSGPLSALLSFDISELGVENSRKVDDSVISHLRLLFTQEQYTDFRIVTFLSQENKEQSQAEFLENGFSTYDTQAGSTHMSVIKVHKAILASRWPHFKRIIDSGMEESHAAVLVIPEVYNSVWMMLYYLYTGNIDFSPVPAPRFSLADYSALLNLANLYELPAFRALIIHVLENKLSTLSSAIAKLAPSDSQNDIYGDLIGAWENIMASGETHLRSQILTVLKYHWTSITRSPAFTTLSKQKIIRLCQDTFETQDGQSTPDFSSSIVDTPGSCHLSPAQSIRRELSNSPFMRSFDEEYSNSPRRNQGLAEHIAARFPSLLDL